MKISSRTILFALVIIGCHPLNASKTAPLVAAETMTVSPTLSSNLSILIPGDMSVCLKINSNKQTVQADFNRILPGITQKHEIGDIYGSPEIEYHKGEEIWYYDEVEFEFKNDEIDLVIASEKRRFKYIIDQYGCPDIILHLEEAHPNEEGYNFILFIYHTIGVMFQHRTTQTGVDPLGLTDVPGVAYYFIPTNTLSECLSEFTWISTNPDITSSLSWLEATK